MKKTLIPLFISAGVLATIIGCETEALSQHSLQISPNSANLALNESITLTASGGWNYKWGLSDTTAGRLSKLTGQSVVYTATKENVTQTVSVTGNGSNPGSGSGSSNETATAVFSASATIVQGAPSQEELTIEGPDTIAPGGSPIVLTASGGDGVNYVWSIQDSSLGRLNRNSGKEVSYTANPNTLNASQQIFVRSDKYTATHVVTHSTTNPLKLVPASATLQKGDSMTFSVIGQNGAVTWSGDSGLTLSTTSGNSCTVRATGDARVTSYILTVSDGAESATASITITE